MRSPSLATKIDNLCKALGDGYQERCLGVLEDQPWQHHVYSVIGPGSKYHDLGATSLKDMIYGNRSIAPRQKYDIRCPRTYMLLTLLDAY